MKRNIFGSILSSFISIIHGITMYVNGSYNRSKSNVLMNESKHNNIPPTIVIEQALRWDEIEKLIAVIADNGKL